MPNDFRKTLCEIEPPSMLVKSCPVSSIHPYRKEFCSRKEVCDKFTGCIILCRGWRALPSQPLPSEHGAYKRVKAGFWP